MGNADKVLIANSMKSILDNADYIENAMDMIQKSMPGILGQFVPGGREGL